MPTHPLVISVKIRGVATKAEDHVIITNLSRSSTKNAIQVKGGGSAEVERGSTWVAGDIINSTLQGRLKGSKQGIITKAGGLSLEIEASADTNSVAVDL